MYFRTFLSIDYWGSGDCGAFCVVAVVFRSRSSAFLEDARYLWNSAICDGSLGLLLSWFYGVCSVTWLFCWVPGMQADKLHFWGSGFWESASALDGVLVIWLKRFGICAGGELVERVIGLSIRLPWQRFCCGIRIDLQVCSVSILSLCFVDSPPWELCLISSRDRVLIFWIAVSGVFLLGFEGLLGYLLAVELVFLTVAPLASVFLSLWAF